MSEKGKSLRLPRSINTKSAFSSTFMELMVTDDRTLLLGELRRCATGLISESGRWLAMVANCVQVCSHKPISISREAVKTQNLLQLLTLGLSYQ